MVSFPYSSRDMAVRMTISIPSYFPEHIVLTLPNGQCEDLPYAHSALIPFSSISMPNRSSKVMGMQLREAPASTIMSTSSI